MAHKTGNALLAFVTTLWLGLLAGVSFLATPVKFQAANLELPVALEVGRVTFVLFSKVELGLSLALLLCLVLARPGVLARLAACFAVAIVIGEAFWLLPALEERVRQVISGTPSAASSYHLWYVLGEAAKAALLLGLSIYSLWRLAGRPAQEQN